MTKAAISSPSPSAKLEDLRWAARDFATQIAALEERCWMDGKLSPTVDHLAPAEREEIIAAIDALKEALTC